MEFKPHFYRSNRVKKNTNNQYVYVQYTFFVNVIARYQHIFPLQRIFRRREDEKKKDFQFLKSIRVLKKANKKKNMIF